MWARCGWIMGLMVPLHLLLRLLKLSLFCGCARVDSKPPTSSLDSTRGRRRWECVPIGMARPETWLRESHMVSAHSRRRSPSATLCNSSPHLRLRTRTSYTVSTQQRRKMHALLICTAASRAASSALHAPCRRCSDRDMPHHTAPPPSLRADSHRMLLAAVRHSRPLDPGVCSPCTPTC
ncbi:hypothetical protein B0H14DRAFT_1684937 [Mycena olivaceomarginata]|nr:hypothetical protein B0H14DRAFT_1684937 [Mycena olivaceomarginata]